MGCCVTQFAPHKILKSIESFNNVKQWMNEIDRYANDKVLLFFCIALKPRIE